MLNEVIEYLPEIIKIKIREYIENFPQKKNLIEEIRLRINQNIVLKIGQDMEEIKQKVTKDIIQETFESICEKSVYSYIKQIAEGFVTIKGGNRVGIVGTAVIENEKVINMNYISSLNFRIAKEVNGAAIPIYRYVIDIANNTIFNTIIVSPPGGGKTTILRDLVKNISNRDT